MKREGQLMAEIADPENLRLAFWTAAKRKRGKADCLTFRERLNENLAALRADLLAGVVPVVPIRIRFASCHPGHRW